MAQRLLDQSYILEYSTACITNTEVGDLDSIGLGIGTLNKSHRNALHSHSQELCLELRLCSRSPPLHKPLEILFQGVGG